MISFVSCAVVVFFFTVGVQYVTLDAWLVITLKMIKRFPFLILVGTVIIIFVFLLQISCVNNIISSEIGIFLQQDNIELEPWLDIGIEWDLNIFVKTIWNYI